MAERLRHEVDRPGVEATTDLVPALALLLLAPVTAEYLYGYDESTGQIDELLAGLVIFAPLYGGAALIIREVARRRRSGWPAILLLGLAFGFLEAGLLDHSLFNPSYRNIEYWDELFDSGLVPALGLNPNLALTFTTGHMIWSIAVPVAIVEALAPRMATQPWLAGRSLAVVVAAFVAAAAFVVGWHLDQEDFLPSIGQLLGAATVVIALTVAAFALHWPPSPGPGRAFAPLLAAGATFAILVLPTAGDLAQGIGGVEPGSWQRAEASWFLIGWTGFAVNLILLAALGALLLCWTSRPGWSSLHVLAVAGGAVLANVVTAFVAEPIGDVSSTAKLGHNTVALIGTIALLGLAVRRQIAWLRAIAPDRAGDAFTNR